MIESSLTLRRAAADEWNYTAYLPFADHLMNMADYWVTGHGEGPGGYGYNRSMAPYECKHHRGRWCGLEGTIVDMLTFGATPEQVRRLAPLSQRPVPGGA